MDKTAVVDLTELSSGQNAGDQRSTFSVMHRKALCYPHQLPPFWDMFVDSCSRIWRYRNGALEFDIDQIRSDPERLTGIVPHMVRYK